MQQNFFPKPGMYVFTGNDVAYISKSNILRVTTPDGETRVKINLSGKATSLAASLVSNRLAVGYNGGKIQIFEIDQKNKDKYTITNTISTDENSFIKSIVFSPNGMYIACNAVSPKPDGGYFRDRKSRVIVLHPDRKEFKFNKLYDPVVSVTFSPDSNYIAFLLYNYDYGFKWSSDIEFINLSDDNKKTNIYGTFYNKILFAPNGKDFVGIDERYFNLHVCRGRLRLFYHDFRDNPKEIGFGSETPAMKLLPDGKRLILIRGGQLTVFDTLKWMPQFSIFLAGRLGRPDIDISPDSKRMVIFSEKDSDWDGGVIFSKIPRDHFELLEMKSNGSDGFFLYPHYKSKLLWEKNASDRLEDIKMPKKIADTIVSYARK